MFRDVAILCCAGPTCIVRQIMIDSQADFMLLAASFSWPLRRCNFARNQTAAGDSFLANFSQRSASILNNIGCARAQQVKTSRKTLSERTEPNLHT